MNKLTEIREALKAATPGPWKDSHFDNLNKSYVDGCRTICTCETSNRVADARLIARAPEYIAYLLSLLEEKDKALQLALKALQYEPGTGEVPDTDLAERILETALTSSNNEGETI